MTRIQAVDERVVPFSPHDVWRVLAAADAYPQWYPRTLMLRLLRYQPGLIGSEIELRPLGGRGFKCRFVSADAPVRLRVEYFGGFIEGWGEWRLDPHGSGTRVVYEIDVRAQGQLAAWAGALLPLDRIHSRQMSGVLRRLEKRLAATAQASS